MAVTNWDIPISKNPVMIEIIHNSSAICSGSQRIMIKMVPVIQSTRANIKERSVVSLVLHHFWIKRGSAIIWEIKYAIDIIVPIVVNPCIPPSDVTMMNKGFGLKNEVKLTNGKIIDPQMIRRNTLGRDGFTSPVNVPRRTVGIMIKTKAIANVRFRFLSEK